VWCSERSGRTMRSEPIKFDSDARLDNFFEGHVSIRNSPRSTDFAQYGVQRESFFYPHTTAISHHCFLCPEISSIEVQGVRLVLVSDKSPTCVQLEEASFPAGATMAIRSADIDFVISVCDSKNGTSIDAGRIAKKKRGCSFFIAVSFRFILKV